MSMELYNDCIILQNQQGIISSLKFNNYGQLPTIEINNFSTFAVVDGFEIKAGDILITNATSSVTGYLGHAAIANGDNHILDMPGIGKENRQITTADWIKNYTKSGKMIQVFRIKNQPGLASAVAKYADTHYYSTNGTAAKDVHLTYGIDNHLYRVNPTYCSKLVFDAYWYGSGSQPVMQAVSGIVAPYYLIGTFTDLYRPSLVKTYSF